VPSTSFRFPRLGLGVLLLLAAIQPVGAANVTINGAQTYQVIDGFGVNANHRSWTNNELAPVLDALIDQGGMRLFRVVWDLADWESTNDNADPNVMDWAYYSALYSSPEFEKMWDLVAYLNSRGINDTLSFNFQGIGPAWMVTSKTDDPPGTLITGKEDEFAEMIASLLVYARHTRHLQFGLAEPHNEPDHYSDLRVQGIRMTSSQYVATISRISSMLDTNALSEVRFVGPDLAVTHEHISWLATMVNSQAVMSKLAHFGVHDYGYFGVGAESSAVSSFIQESAYSNSSIWMTEYNAWCNNCEDGGLDQVNTWQFARDTAAHLVAHLQNGAAGGVVWEGYDSVYRLAGEDLSIGSTWGLFAADNLWAPTKTYSARKGFYTVSQISRFVRPGARRIDVSGSATPLSLLAFFHPASGRVTLTGVNSGTETSLSGALVSLPSVQSFDLYYTSSATNLCHSQTILVTNDSFAATVPADCVFTLVGFAGQVSVQITALPDGVLIYWPAALTNHVLEVAANLSPGGSVWLPVTNTPQVIGEQQTLKIIPAPAPQFFRLRQQ
jgi:O-glycosyl hydrolase